MTRAWLCAPSCALPAASCGPGERTLRPLPWGSWGGEQQQLQKPGLRVCPKVLGNCGWGPGELWQGAWRSVGRQRGWWDTSGVPRLRLCEESATTRRKGAVTGRTRVWAGPLAGHSRLLRADGGLAPSCSRDSSVRRGVSSVQGAPLCGLPEGSMRRVPGGPRLSIPILHLTQNLVQCRRGALGNAGPHDPRHGQAAPRTQGGEDRGGQTQGAPRGGRHSRGAEAAVSRAWGPSPGPRLSTRSSTASGARTASVPSSSG